MRECARRAEVNFGSSSLMSDLIPEFIQFICSRCGHRRPLSLSKMVVCYLVEHWGLAAEQVIKLSQCWTDALEP